METQVGVSALALGEFDINDRLILRQVFQKLGWKLLEALDRTRAMVLLDCNFVQVVVTESRNPNWTWRLLLQDLQRRGQRSQLVVTSRDADDGLWAEVLNLGGYDLLLSQPLDPNELERVIVAAARRSGIPPGTAGTELQYRPRVA